MTSEQHNRKFIKEKFINYNLSDEIIEKIRVLCSEQYTNGLKQKEFDLNMDLIQQLQAYKEKNKEIRKEIKLFKKGKAYDCAEDLIDYIEEFILNE
jgi:hypothetical protein